jgi:hypothetical protein
MADKEIISVGAQLISMLPKGAKGLSSTSAQAVRYGPVINIIVAVEAEFAEIGVRQGRERLTPWPLRVRLRRAELAVPQ